MVETEEEFDGQFQDLRELVDEVVLAAKKAGRAAALHEIALHFGVPDAIEGANNAKIEAEENLEVEIADLDNAIEPYGNTQEKFKKECIRFGMVAGL